MFATGDKRLFHAVLVAGGMSVALFLAAPGGGAWQMAAWFLPQLFATGLLIARTRTSPPAVRGPLLLLVAGQSAYLGLSASWFAWPVVFGSPLPIPSPLDAGYFAVYGIYALFLLALLQRRAHDRAVESRIALTDAVILTTALSALAWVGIIEPNLSNGTPVLSTAVAIAYPAFNLLLFALAARLAIIGRLLRSTPGALLLLWIVAQIAGDLFYGYHSADGTSEYRSLTTGRMVGYVALAALAAHPGLFGLLEEPARPSRGGRARHDARSNLARRVRLGLLLIAALVPLGLVATGIDHEHDLALIAASALSSTLVVYRAALLSGDLNEQRRLADQLGEAAERMRAILDTAGDGIYGVDIHRRVTFANPAAAQMLGYSPEELIGRNSHELFHEPAAGPTGHAAGSCLVALAMESRILQRSSAESFRRRDKTSFPVEKVATPMVESGRITGAVVSFRDITQRREVDRLKSEFTSIVSHELRTPLTSIRGSLGLLASGALGDVPAKGQRMLDIAVSNTDRLVRLINDILDIERIESGTISMDKQRIAVADLVAEARDAMDAMAVQAGVAVTVSAEEVHLWADPDRMMQTLTNLLSNAIKFSDVGGTVRLSADRIGDDLLIRVRDEGRGIPADRLDAVFERFQQVDSSDAREKGGTGLGLPICRSIVEQHGGRIWVESAPGEGSTFFVSLPALGESETAGDPGAGNPAVLVCDDDPSVRETISALLQRRGFRVLAAASGEEALDIAARERPVAILLDLLMPGLSGWETAARLKARPETDRIPVVMCSVLSPEEAELSADLPVAGWVDKPVDDDSLVAALDKALSADRPVTRVLVVEDDPDLAGVLTTMFERHGVQTFHAATGDEALQLSQRVLPDLLVLDLMLPDCDGFAVTDWLRRHERLHRIPLVVYTARDLDEGQRERLRLGDTQFFTKGRVSLAHFERCVIGLLTGTTTEASLVR